MPEAGVDRAFPGPLQAAEAVASAVPTRADHIPAEVPKEPCGGILPLQQATFRRKKAPRLCSGRRGRRLAARQKTLQILAVFAFADRLDQPGEARIVDIALAPGDLLGTADLQALAILDGFDE